MDTDDKTNAAQSADPALTDVEEPSDKADSGGAKCAGGRKDGGQAELSENGTAGVADGAGATETVAGDGGSDGGALTNQTCTEVTKPGDASSEAAHVGDSNVGSKEISFCPWPKGMNNPFDVCQNAKDSGDTEAVKEAPTPDWRTSDDVKEWVAETGRDPFQAEDTGRYHSKRGGDSESEGESEGGEEKRAKIEHDYSALYCEVCERHFRTDAEKEAHDGSKKHRRQVGVLEERGKEEKGEETAPVQQTFSIFSGVGSSMDEVNKLLRDEAKSLEKTVVPDSFKAWAEQSLRKASETGDGELVVRVKKEVTLKLVQHKRNCDLYTWSWMRVPLADGSKFV